MPPVSKANQTTVRKDVDFIAKDDEEQIATGIVMVPWAVDLQNDWERPETIQSFAEQFENFEEVGEASGGVMHAVFPDEHLSLETNTILEEQTEIGGKTVPAGAWRQDWRFEDDELWTLVDDGIFQGYSIGAEAVHWEGPMEQEDLPEEVTVPDEIGEDELVWELVDGIIREVSTVDIPAVPDAQILSTKTATEKRLAEHLGNRDGFIEEALQRGHSEAEAERMWEYLNRAVDIEGAGEPGKESYFRRVGETVVSALWGSDDDVGAAVHDAVDADPRKRSDADPDGKGRAGGDGKTAAVTKEDTVGVDVYRITAAEDDDTDYDGDLLGMAVDFPEHDVYVDWRRDAFPDALEDPHVSIYGSVEDLQQATGNEIESLDSVESPTDGFAAEAQRIREKAVEEADNYAAGGDTPDDDPNTTDMTDDPDGGDGATDAKALAEQNAEQISELTDSVKELTESITGPEPKTAEIQIDGETYEVREDAAKAALGVGDDVDVEEAIQRLNEKASRVDDLEQRIETISRQSGRSTQLDASRDGDGGEGNEGGLEGLGKALS
jgi:hypothetical protein